MFSACSGGGGFSACSLRGGRVPACSGVGRGVGGGG